MCRLYFSPLQIPILTSSLSTPCNQSIVGNDIQLWVQLREHELGLQDAKYQNASNGMRIMLMADVRYLCVII